MNASPNEHFPSTHIDSCIHLLKSNSRLLLPKLKTRRKKTNSPTIKIITEFSTTISYSLFSWCIISTSCYVILLDNTYTIEIRCLGGKSHSFSKYWRFLGHWLYEINCNVANSDFALLYQMRFGKYSETSHNYVLAHCRTNAILQSNPNILFQYSKNYLLLPAAQVSPFTLFSFYFFLCALLVVHNAQ